MSAACAILTPDSPAWDAALAPFAHDFYHLAGYLRMAAEDAGGTALAFHLVSERCELFLPLVVRPLPDWCGGGCDGISPYGYPGPLLRWSGPQGTPDPHALEVCLQALTAALRERGLVSAFIRCHPLVPLPEEGLATYGAFPCHGSTVSLDLTLDEQALWQGVRSGHRTEIRQAQRHGMVVEHDQDWSDVDGFLEAYHQTMARVGASTGYFFDRTYVDRLRGALAGRAQLLVARDAGRLLAAAIFVETAGTVQYHLSGTRDDCTRLRPTKPLLWEAARWAKARGNRILHLGGGVGGQEDSLFQFKAGFSARRHAFHTWRLIVDQAAYDHCSALARGKAGGADPGDFFPAYRAMG